MYCDASSIVYVSAKCCLNWENFDGVCCLCITQFECLIDNNYCKKKNKLWNPDNLLFFIFFLKMVNLMHKIHNKCIHLSVKWK